MKPNDRVRIIGTSNDFLEQYIGSVGVVVTTWDGGEKFSVKVSGGTLDDTWQFTKEHLEVVQ